MKLAFSEYDQFGNGRGVHAALEKTIIPDEVSEIRNYYAGIGWQEGTRTRKLSDAEISRIAGLKRRKVSK